MKPSRSQFRHIRGLCYHLRHWGPEDGEPLLLLHGWLDVSGTFQHMVDALDERWHVIAPDWRGLGYSGWAPGGYWFPDYVADLDAIVDRLDPPQALRLIGHSMGAQAASLYAGLRPARVRDLVIMDGLFLPDMEAELAPRRFGAWLDQQKHMPEQREYDGFEDLAHRIRKQHPKIDEQRALFVARCWGREDGHGRVRLCADPRHRLRGPSLYRAAESMAIWRQITARTLFIDGSESAFTRAIHSEEVVARRECFARREQALVTGAGHMLHFDAPEDTARQIDAFLAAG